MHTLHAITPGVVAARGEAMITYGNRSRRNYTRMELAIERLGSSTRWSIRARRLNVTRRLGIESSEAERSLEAGYSTCRSVSVDTCI